MCHTYFIWFEFKTKTVLGYNKILNLFIKRQKRLEKKKNCRQ